MKGLIKFNSTKEGRSLIEGTAVVTMEDGHTVCTMAFYLTRRSGKLVARLAEGESLSWSEAWNKGVLVHDKVEWEAGKLPSATEILRKLGIK